MTEAIREYWDIDAATYDRSASHHPSTPLQRAAWRGALAQLVGERNGLRVLDVGAGTGFLSLLLAELGHRVTAADLSSGMLEQLQRKAAECGYAVSTMQTDATGVPAGPFDVVVSRHLMWLLPDPVAALRAWAAAAPSGRLVLVDSEWGSSADATERVRRSARHALARVRRTPPAHHADFDEVTRERLPLGHGPSPAELLEVVTAAGWAAPQAHRLDTVEWAMRERLPWPERALGVPPLFAIVADSPAPD